MASYCEIKFNKKNWVNWNKKKWNQEIKNLFWALVFYFIVSNNKIKWGTYLFYINIKLIQQDYSLFYKALLPSNLLNISTKKINLKILNK